MSSACLSDGKQAVMRMESSSMPRKTRQVVGPTHFSGDNGIPMSLATWSIASRHDVQIVELGGPNVK